ncbi:hypothetical protein EXIGLDRAFT_733769 [Exidia glandulosa HHB12029]|uniref:Uncharacterized protein n=1 Tax=Exidia glandulosa HHB12029 TaxID=1314781 RepID=A0A165KE88_EXIGL|nr:hypothetical protein EXIGLDRAFT_733769 [Exidia glandulosa HHB12029]
MAYTVIPLFPEEGSIRILGYAVHPLDSAGVPYAGGPNANILLKRASRALRLPPESTKSYLDALVTSPGTHFSARSSYRHPPPTSASPPPALEVIHTGSIQVSNYSICFVLPKMWPQVRAESESDDFLSRASTPSSASRSRRSSVGGSGKSFRFMAGIEVWVPYLSMPPKSPYLLSIPVPRCLANNLKLKIFPPPQPGWELTTEPVVQYKNSGLQGSRHGHVADDESFSDASETSTNTENGTVTVHGAFQSTDRLRIRWAPASSNSESLPLDGWHRAKCDTVEGKLKITVLDVLRPPQNPAGFRLALEYSASCKGVFHPGVAVRLAMDVLLDTKGQTVTWADTTPDAAGATWEVRGGAGYKDFDVGGKAPTTPVSLSRRASGSSFDSPSIPGSPVPYDDRSLRTRKSSIPVPAAPTSLLNVPLPLDGVQDYSFETAVPTTPGRPPSSMSSSALSGISQISTSVSGNEQQRLALNGHLTSPANRIALQIDMDQILPKSRQEGSSFEYSITGVVDVVANSQLPVFSSESEQTDDDPTERLECVLDLPVFRMFNVDEEHIQVQVVSEVAGVMLASGSDSSARASSSALRMNGAGRTKRALRVGVPMACTEDGQLSVRLTPAPVLPVIPKRETTYSSLGSPIAPNATFPPSAVNVATESMRLRMPRLAVSSLKPTSGMLTDVEETGRSSISPSVAGGFDIITNVHVTVEPLPSSTTQMRAHAVMVRMPAAGIDTPTVDFALKTRSATHGEKPLSVQLVYAAVGGRPVEAKVYKGDQHEPGAVALSDGADATWIRVHLGSTSGSLADVEVLYTVTHSVDDASLADNVHPVIPPEGATCVAVLPSFYTRIGFMEVGIRRPQGYRVESIQSNLGNQAIQASPLTSLTRYALPTLFAPQLSVCLVNETQRAPRRYGRSLLALLPLLLAALALLLVFLQHTQIQDLHAFLLGSQPSPYYTHRAYTPPTASPRHNETQEPLAEHGLAVRRTPHSSISLRTPDLRALLASLSVQAAVDALNNLLANALHIVRRILHYPLEV